MYIHLICLLGNITTKILNTLLYFLLKRDHETEKYITKHLPPPQVAEQSDPGVDSQWYLGREQDEPSPPQTPHSSTRRVEPTRRSQPTLC